MFRGIDYGHHSIRLVKFLHAIFPFHVWGRHSCRAARGNEGPFHPSAANNQIQATSPRDLVRLYAADVRTNRCAKWERHPATIILFRRVRGVDRREFQFLPLFGCMLEGLVSKHDLRNFALHTADPTAKAKSKATKRRGSGLMHECAIEYDERFLARPWGVICTCGFKGAAADEQEAEQGQNGAWSLGDGHGTGRYRYRSQTQHWTARAASCDATRCKIREFGFACKVCASLCVRLRASVRSMLLRH